MTLRFSVDLQTFVVYFGKHVQIHSLWYYKWCLLRVFCTMDDCFTWMISKCMVLYWLNKIYSSLFIFPVRLGFQSTITWPEISLYPYFRIIDLLLLVRMMLSWQYWLLSHTAQEMQGMVKVLDKCFIRSETTHLYLGVCWSGSLYLRAQNRSQLYPFRHIMFYTQERILAHFPVCKLYQHESGKWKLNVWTCSFPVSSPKETWAVI